MLLNPYTSKPNKKTAHYGALTLNPKRTAQIDGHINPPGQPPTNHRRLQHRQRPSDLGESNTSQHLRVAKASVRAISVILSA